MKGWNAICKHYVKNVIEVSQMHIKGGYILQPRIIDESKTSRFPPHVREIWLYLLRRANHEDRVVHGTLIKRGQLKTSYRDILEDLSWYVGFRKESYKKHHCETAMKLLTREQMVTTMKTTRGMIVTVCNYDYYQTPENYETDSEHFNEATRDRQSTDRINKNEKNERIKEDIEKTIPKGISKKQNGCINKPTIQDVYEYCKAEGCVLDVEKWYSYYEANGWKVGRNPMKDWKACIRHWLRNNTTNNKHNGVYQRERDDKRREAAVPNWDEVKDEDMRFV